MMELINKVCKSIEKRVFLKTLRNFLILKNPIKLNFLRHKPDFLIIGAMKTGTTYAFNLLNQHPKLNLPKEKEIHYFDMNFKFKDKWYKSQFPLKFNNKKLSWEASPYYIYHPLAPERAYKFNPAFKIIVFLRNPTYRAISHYNMTCKLASLKWDPTRLSLFEIEDVIQRSVENKLINLEQDANPIHRNFSFIRRGIYLNQIKQWHKFFPKENFLFIKSEDFYNDPDKIIGEICDFLNIRKIENLNLKVYKHKGDYKNQIDVKILDELKFFYKPHNEELEKYLNMKFNWD